MTSADRFLLTSFAVACAAAACTGSATPPQCPDGTVRDGARCVPPVALAPADPRTVQGGGEPVDGGSAADVGPRPDAGDGVAALPFFVETYYTMTGFFSENQAATVDRTECSGVSGTAPGANCMQIAFTANGDRFGGFFWQYPENNFGMQPGLRIADGAQQVRFRAWGATGSETVKFGVGIDNAEPNSDGFNVETRVLTLETEPTEYFIDLRGVDYDRVAGGFSWIVEDADGQGTTTFFIDNIEWTDEAPEGGGGVEVPFWVDEHFAMSGFFPGPPGVMDVTESCPGFDGTDPASTCRRITFSPNGLEFGGFFFQSPPDNFGAEPGLAVAPGATRITFRAWGETGAERVVFGAGVDNDLPNDDGWNVENPPVTLGTTPQEYSVDIAGVGYDRVVGGFLWVLQTPDGATEATFYLDNVRWE